MTVSVTSYQSLKSQTDSTPFITSIGDRVSNAGCAVSHDLLKAKVICYGDAVQIPNLGIRIVNDTMNIRIKRSIDIWVPSYEAEKLIGLRLNQVITVIKSPQRRCRK